MRVLAILQNMWDDRGSVRTAPLKFRINPLNYSGKRLYKLIGEGEDLWVTNASREVSRKASEHKTQIDLKSLVRVLLEDWDLVLVCGRVAHAAFDQAMTEVPERGTPALKIDHPAARRWSKEKLEVVRSRIQGILHPEGATSQTNSQT